MCTDVRSMGAPGRRVCCCTSWASLLSKYLSTLSGSTFKGTGLRLKNERSSRRNFCRSSSKPPSFKIGPTMQHLSNGGATFTAPVNRSLNPWRMVFWISGVSKYSCLSLLIRRVACLIRSMARLGSQSIQTTRSGIIEAELT